MIHQTVSGNALLTSFLVFTCCKPKNETLESNLKDAGFFQPGELSAVPSDIRKVWSAVQYLYVDSWLSWERGRCSGAFISNDGYFLTAAHCLSTCLPMEKKIDHDKIRMSVAPSHGRDKPDRRCDRLKLPLAKLENPHIVYVGGDLVFDLKTVDRANDADFAVARKEWRDFAIVKFDTPKALGCVPLTKRHLAAGERVWSFGFPASASRTNDGVPSSEGDRMYVTYGRSIANLKGNEAFERMKLGAAQQTSARMFVEMPHVLLSNMDGMGGQSGSPIVDGKGLLAGVFSNMVTGNLSAANEFVGDAAVGIRSETLWREISAELGPQTAASVFNCK